MKRFLACLVSATTALAAPNSYELPTAKITVQATDEQGKPLSQATVLIGFEPAIPTWGGSPPVNVRGQTDLNGEFSASGHSDGYLNGRVTKPGYYTSWSAGATFTDAVDGKWQPWNPTLEAVLKKIVNPIPMYARRMTTQLPVLNQPVGFDFVESDWLPPYGHGKTADFIFEGTRDFVSTRDYTADLSLTFSNPGDGIQSVERVVSEYDGMSMLRLSGSAPQDGYAGNWLRPSSQTPGPAIFKKPSGEEKKTMGYFYRVRSVKQKAGPPLSMYGKIDGDIEWGVAKTNTVWIKFTYYLNPTPDDHNVEFDPKRNLLTHLGPLENVKYP